MGIGDVENLPPKLQLLFFAPRHGDGFAQSKVDINITGKVKGVALAGLAGICVAEAAIGRQSIAAKELWRSVGVAAGWALPDRGDLSGIALCIPVSGPTHVIERRRKRKTGIPAVDAG